jgi:transposase-like protein
MAFVQVHCPDCQSPAVVQYGKQANGTQRYRCDNPDCPRTIFLLEYRDKGRLPAVKQQIIDMTLNPTFKGVWSTATNFVPLSPLDTRSGQYPQHYR